MQKLFTLFILIIILPISIVGQSYDFQNVRLLSRWDGAGNAVGWANNRYASLKGFSKDNRKYAIIGSANGTHFVDITNYTSPVQVDYVPGALQNCTWREYEVKNNICYAISDDSGNNAFQIIDMQYLPDSVHVIHNSRSIFNRSHTLYIDGDKLYCAGVTNNSGYSVVNVYDISTPSNPVLLRKLGDDYPSLMNQAHDMFVKNDTVYVSGGYSGLFVFKFNTNNTFTLIGSITSYVSQGYNHNSALMSDGKTLIMTDEVPSKLKVKAVDISDMTDIVVLDTFQSAYGNTPHNAYNAGVNNRSVIAYYEDGIQIFDCSNPANVQCTGYFDTHYQTVGEAAGDYAGAWGAYIFPDDFTVIASDMQNGLYVLDASLALGINTSNVHDEINNESLSYNPNPFTTQISIEIQTDKNEKTNLELIDLNGKTVLSQSVQLVDGKNNFTMNTSNIKSGVYFIRTKYSLNFFSKKVVKF